MSSFRDLSSEWLGLMPDCAQCWTAADLQLAAELGKTLLERNKELEATLKHHQNVIDDQTQEIEYLTKQTAALKEVNDSRLRIYEQLEISIQELERTNQKLNQQTSTDKSHIKALYGNIETLENRCEELQRSVDQLTVELETEKRRTQCLNEAVADPSRVPHQQPQRDIRNISCKEQDDEIRKLLQQIQEIRSLKAKEERKVTDLEDQLNAVLKENRYLGEQLDALKQKEENFKGIQEELSALEQIRQGHLCRRCLRTTGSLCADELSLTVGDENDEHESVSDLESIIENQRNEVLKQIQMTFQDDDKNENPYRILVEKYEALLKVQQQKFDTMKQHIPPTPQNCLSLQEELQLTGKYSFQKEEIYDSDECESPHISAYDSRKPIRKQSAKSQGDYMETETSSSGFSDDISNKGTQTDVHVLPGSFLCKISDGTDCQFSIYDDASPIESRFRKTPEYRQLFKEIFLVLRRAAEAKDDGEPLPLLDDRTPMREELPKVPPVTPAREGNPFLEETLDSVNTLNATLTNKQTSEDGLTAENTDDQSLKLKSKQEQGVKMRKKDRRNKHDKQNATETSQSQKHSATETSSQSQKHSGTETPSQSQPSTPKRSSSKAKRRKDKFMNSPNRSKERHQQRSSLCIPLPANLASNSGNERSDSKERPKSLYDPHASSASQEVAKLKILDKSYAEVLRMGRRKCTPKQLSTQYYYNSQYK